MRLKAPSFRLFLELARVSSSILHLSRRSALAAGSMAGLTVSVGWCVVKTPWLCCVLFVCLGGLILRTGFAILVRFFSLGSIFLVCADYCSSTFMYIGARYRSLSSARMLLSLIFFIAPECAMSCQTVGGLVTLTLIR